MPDPVSNGSISKTFCTKYARWVTFVVIELFYSLYNKVAKVCYLDKNLTV